MSAALRAPTTADAPLAARLVGLHWPEPVDAARIEHDWSAPGVDLAHDARIGDGVYVLEEWSRWHLQPPRFAPDLWFAARAGSESCGVVICHPHPTVPDLGWIGVLAVRSEWRRRGIGRALLLHAFERLREAGLRRAGLGVDSDSVTGAHTLYESVGMRPAERFEIYEKSLA